MEEDLTATVTIISSTNGRRVAYISQDKYHYILQLKKQDHIYKTQLFFPRGPDALIKCIDEANDFVYNGEHDDTI